MLYGDLVKRTEILLMLFYWALEQTSNLESAPHHNESEPTRPKCREGSATRDLKMSTAPQRERPDRPKVPRGLRERSQNEHRATTRAIWQAQSAERVTRAISKWAPRHNESDLTGPKWRKGCARSLRATVSCETSAKNGRGRSFCAVRITKFAGHGWDHLEWTPSLNPHRKNPKCGHTVWGKWYFLCKTRHVIKMRISPTSRAHCLNGKWTLRFHQQF